jgi:hypothetical protein
MKFPHFLLAAAVLALSVPSVSQSGEAAKVSADINAAMNRYESYLRKKDAKGVEATIRSMFAKEFKDTGLNGRTITLEQFVAQQKMNVATLKSISNLDVKMADVKINGAEGKGKGSLILEAVIFEPNNQKKTHKLKVQSIWNSTFRKVGGKWWIVADKTTHEKVWMDGKPVQ